jgi:hypothetical protein
MQPEGSLPSHKIPPLVPIPSQINPVHTTQFYSVKYIFEHYPPTYVFGFLVVFPLWLPQQYSILSPLT